ncbi:hypothetical protein MHI32_01505 [Paenibacillus sp. FSL H7-0690]|uniref:hypothetical protein n=1 Tax=Paenibacillus sp. FSL H7-0690 TaxID=2921437 RepID=UPI0030EC86DC
MTQVKDKTDQKLNRALAELMGWRVIQSHTAETGGGAPYYQLVAPGFGGRHYREPEDTWKYVPDYCTDPAASLEVQTAAIKENYIKYVSTLCDILDGESDEMSGELSPEAVADMLTASPRERAEAAYITLQDVEQQMISEPCCLVGRCQECDPITE